MARLVSGRTTARSTRTASPGPRRDAAQALLRLQRSAGNRATRLAVQRQPAKGIAVRPGSKLSAQDLLGKVTANKKVPEWLRKGLGATKTSLVKTGTLSPPANEVWTSLEYLEAALDSGRWQITTARSTIKVDKGGTWSQRVVPDLASGERLGDRFKAGPGGETGFRSNDLVSSDHEVIYGWTIPNTATNLDAARFDLVVVVREIEVTAPNGKTKVFKPGPDEMAEALLHEIAVHAGRITKGRTDTHGNQLVEEDTEEIGEIFRAADPAGGLQPSPLTKQIFAFVGGAKRAPVGAP